MKTAIIMLTLSVLAMTTIVEAMAGSRSGSSRSESRPRIGHHSGMNGPSRAGWGGGGGYHQ